MIIYCASDVKHFFLGGDQNNPLAKVVFQDCAVNASSNIRLLESDVCDSDSLLVDGQECAIMSVTLGSTGSFE